jgi:excisionase family DNA binding protein
VTNAMLTARQVGDLLDVDATTVYRMAGDGRLPAVRVGRQWRFPADAIDALLVPATGGPPLTDPTPGAALVPPQLATAVLETVAPALGVSMVVTDVAGRPITAVVNPAPYLAAHLDDPDFLASCVHDWGGFAADPELAPRLRPSRFGFLCAHSFVRAGASLTAMVLAGGIAPPGGAPVDGLFTCDADQRRLVLETLPRVAALLSRLTTPERPTGR